MQKIYLFILLIFLLLIDIGIIFLHLRKREMQRKIYSMSKEEKKNLLDELAKAGGYTYDASQDIFSTRQDAPQKLFGYTALYDSSAPYFNMVFDYETIYFNHEGRTWLFELWKGQYGINTGCEAGIYYADKIIPPDRYNAVLFQPVSPQNMPEISLKLSRYSHKKQSTYRHLGHIQQKHWWLTIFKTGVFTKPKDLLVNISIGFPNYSMMYHFLDGFKQTLPFTTYKIRGLHVYFSFFESQRQYSFFQKAIRKFALFCCKLYCQWFCWITKPFSNSGDKLLYLYFYLPFTIRHFL